MKNATEDKKAKDLCAEPAAQQGSDKHVGPAAGAWDCNAIFGDKLVTKDGIQSTSDVLKDKKYIGIYFSASW
jgi:hypothetical protein